MEAEIIKMSSKGQLVVPQEIREQEGFGPADRFISFPIKDGVMFKKIELPDSKKEFELLAQEVQKQFKKKNINKKDVKEAIKWARKR